MFHWPYYELRLNGCLYDEDGRLAFPDAPGFKTAQDAESWLVENDIRGNIREKRRAA